MQLILGTLCLGVVTLLGLAFFPPRSLLSWLSRRSGVRFFFTRDPTHIGGGGGSSVGGRGLRVALTIDDAPSDGTNLILDVLHSLDIPATFFIIGSSALSRLNVLERITQGGHEMANHDWVDRRSCVVPLQELLKDLARTAEVLRPYQQQQSQQPYSSTKWFRPGAGFYTNRMVRAVKSEFNYETVLTDCYSHDIRLRSPSLIQAHMSLRVTDGSIMLLHDGSMERAKRTVEVLKRLIPTLKARGFTFATLTQLKEEQFQ